MVTQYTTTAGHLIDGVTIVNGTVDLNGTANALILDADGDTHISAPTENQIDIAVAGADDFSITANKLNVLTGSEITGASSNFFFMSPIAAQQNLSGAGAINVTSKDSFWTTTGANAGTLADGVRGQYKRIIMTVDAGDGTLTPSNLASGTTIVFSNVGDCAELYFNGTDWVAISLFNVATGSITTPVLA